jgi:RHS repeat-associated protein
LVLTSPNVIQVDATGKGLAILGTMHDDGLGGDAVAGDRTFTLQFSLAPSQPGTIYLRVSAAFKGVLQRVQSPSMTVTVTPAIVLPPDPATVAPPLTAFAATPLGAATKFLYDGTQPIQTGVDKTKMIPASAGVMRGRVITRDDQPLPGVRITILSHPEFGQTFSRSDGWFDMAVNAGGLLTVSYDKPGFLPAHRSIPTSWLDYRVVPDVVLSSPDPNATKVDPQLPFDFVTARGPVVTDGDGQRRATLFFPHGMQASMVMPDGSRQPLSTFTVRVSEFTIGKNGPAAMPGALPPSSQYTYAADLQVDEAVAAGAKTVEFSKPVLHYTENFLDFPVGTFLPVGFYDRDRAVWSGTLDGRVVKILYAVQGLAVLDVDGLGQPATAAELTALGITIEEARQLLLFYPPGQTLWRVTYQHFSSGDINLPKGRPANNQPPSSIGYTANKSTGNPCSTFGSIIDCHNQVLGESVPVVGTPWRLHYSSERQQGRRIAANTLIIPLTDANPPALVSRIGLRISLAGRSWFSCYAPTPSLTTTFTWDGLDAYGRALVGAQKVTATTYYFYPVLQGGYSSAGSGGNGGGGGGGGGAIAGISWAEFSATPGAGIGKDRGFLQEDSCSSVGGLVSVKKDWTAIVNGGDARGNNIAGWSLSAHHFYDSLGQSLLLGDGTRRDLNLPELQNRISVMPGSTCSDINNLGLGDGGPISKACLFATLIAYRSDGLYYLSSTSRIRSVNGDGIINTVMGGAQSQPTDPSGGNTNPGGDNGPAVNAKLTFVKDIAVGPQGDLFILDWQRVRRIGTDGIVRPFAGTGEQGFGGDGGAATAAKFLNPTRIAVAADGTVYITDTGNLRIRKINPDGIIRTIAGTGLAPRSILSGAPAIGQALNPPTGIAVTPTGSVVFTEAQGQAATEIIPARIREITPEGLINTLAGAGATGYCGDGGLAVDACVANNTEITVGPDGTIYFVSTGDGTWSIRHITADGMIWRFAGSAVVGVSNGNYNIPALQTDIDHLDNLEFAPDGTLQFFNGTAGEGPQVRLSGPFQGLGLGDTVVGSEDGSEVYVFDEYGQHLRTLDPWTGATVLTFGYDSERRLINITDEYGNVTTIERDATGVPMGISSPFGPFTALTVGADGMIASIANPAGETTKFSYGNGLMSVLTDPRSNLHSFQYDSEGRLTFDGDPAGGSKALARTGTLDNAEVTVTTALGRATKYASDRTSPNDEKQVLTDSAGFQTLADYSASGAFTAQYADKSNLSLTRTGDPRWAMGSPFVGSLQFNLPSGLLYKESASRTATLSDPQNPFSLTRLQQSTTINSRTYQTVYTASTRTFTLTSPANRLFITILDANGRVTQTQYGNLAAVSYSYDARGRLKTISQGTGTDLRLVTLAYDASGFLAGVTDPLGRTVQFTYDLAGRVKTQILPPDAPGSSPRTIAFDYDHAGNLASLTPPGRTAHTFSYTPIDLPAVYTAPAVTGGGTNTSETAYNKDRQVSSLLRPDSKTISLDFDAAGRTKTLTFPEGQYGLQYSATTGQVGGVSSAGGIGLGFAYDGPLLASASWTGGITGSVTRTYDSDLRVAAISLNGDPIAYGYDTDNLITNAGSLTMTRYSQTGLLQTTTLDSITDSFTYNSFGEVATYSAKFGNASLYAVTYHRDPLGRITQKDETTAGTMNTLLFEYDGAGRLKSVTKNAVATQYSYDANGNRLMADSVAGTYDAQDRLTQYGSATYTYTPAGELLTKTLGGQTTTYSYDALGNLRKVSLPDGHTIDYLIDSANRRVGKKKDGVLVKTWLYQDGLRPIAEIDAASSVTTRFVYASSSNVPAYMVKAGVKYRMITDQVGSVRMVVSTTAGAPAQTLEYDAFGRVLADSAAGFQPFGFAGGLYDPDTGLVRFGARDYDAVVGRWTKKDPILFSGGETSLYVYCVSDPINLRDHSGLANDSPSPVTILFGLAGLGTAVGRVVTAVDTVLADALFPGATIGTSVSALGVGASIAAVSSSLAIGLTVGTIIDYTYKWATGSTLGDDWYDLLHPEDKAPAYDPLKDPRRKPCPTGDFPLPPPGIV